MPPVPGRKYAFGSIIVPGQKPFSVSFTPAQIGQSVDSGLDTLEKHVVWIRDDRLGGLIAHSDAGCRYMSLTIEPLAGNSGIPAARAYQVNNRGPTGYLLHRILSMVEDKE